MKKTKKALASLAIAGMTLSMIPFNVFAAAPTTTRISGVTAEQTAVKIADQTGYTGTAVLASSTSYGMVDALTAGPLAASLKAPILLTGAGSTLNADTKAELTKLAVKKVYVTSGTAVIKQGVVDELKAMGIEVVALGGFDRAETSVNIAKQMTGVTKVAVANGIPDALSIASVAAAANEPILLTDKDALPASVAAYLAANAGITASDVIGGTGVISDAVKAALPGATRHFGMTAYDTNNQVIQDFASSLQFDNLYVANGVTGIDALAGAPLAAQTKSAIVLTDGKSVPAAAAFTFSKSPSDAVVTALGGEAVVPEAVRAGVEDGKVTTPVGDLAIVSVSALTDDGHVLSVAFNKQYVGALDKSMISIFATASGSRVGVESVQLASNGLSAEVILYDNTSEGAAAEIARLKEYTIKIGALTANFTRPGYVDKDTNNARVTAVDSVERELEVSYTGGSKVLEVPASVNIDFQDALGQYIQVWYNGDDQVIKYAYQSNSVLLDAVEVTTSLDISEKDGELNLVEADKDYDISSDVVLYVDGDEVAGAAAIEAALEEDDTFDSAKIVLNDDGDVAYINAFNWDGQVIVESVEDGVLYGHNEDLDTEDYVIVKDGKQISASDIKAGDIVYYNEDAYGDGFAEVFNGVVKGEITDFFSDGFELGGETYDYGAAQSLDSDGDIQAFGYDQAEEMAAAGGTVTVNLNRNGDVIFVSGDSVAVKGDEQAAYLTEDILGYQSAARDYIELEYVDAEGEAQLDTVRLQDLESISVDGTEYEIDNSSTPADKYFVELNQDAGTENESILLTQAGTANGVSGAADEVIDITGTDNTVIEITKDDDGNITDLNFITTTGAIFNSAAYTFETDDSYVKVDDADHSKKLADDVVVFNTEEGTDPEDITVSTYGDLKVFDVTAGTVFFDGDQATSLVISNTDATESTDVDAVVTEVRTNDDGDIVRLTAFVKGEEKTYTVDESDEAVAPGDVVTLTVDDESGVVESIATGISRETAELGVNSVNLSDKEIVVDGTLDEYTLVSGAVVYDITDPSDITVESLRDIDSNSKVIFVLDGVGTKFVRAVLITE